MMLSLPEESRAENNPVFNLSGTVNQWIMASRGVRGIYTTVFSPSVSAYVAIKSQAKINGQKGRLLGLKKITVTHTEIQQIYDTYYLHITEFGKITFPLKSTAYIHGKVC